MPLTGNLILQPWTVLDTNSNPLTGMHSPADVTLVLQRQSGSAIVAASEIVTMTEIGSTGRYYIGFTPTNSGRYVLYLKEINATSFGRTEDFNWDVTTAGAVFSASY